MRELKADIKDNVWIKASVEEIRITATGVKYKVAVEGIIHEVFEEDLETAPKCEPVKELVKKEGDSDGANRSDYEPDK